MRIFLIIEVFLQPSLHLMFNLIIFNRQFTNFPQLNFSIALFPLCLDLLLQICSLPVERYSIVPRRLAVCLPLLFPCTVCTAFGILPSFILRRCPYHFSLIHYGSLCMHHSSNVRIPDSFYSRCSGSSSPKIHFNYS